MKKLFSIACFLIGFVMLSSSAFSNPGDPVKPTKKAEKKAFASVTYRFSGTDATNPNHWTLVTGSLPNCGPDTDLGQYCYFVYDDANGLTKAQAVAAVSGTSLTGQPKSFQITSTATTPNTVITIIQRAP